MSHLIKIAPSAKEKKEQRDAEKDIQLLTGETSGVKNKRDEDIFFEGPMHGLVVKHAPNGPPASWDPKNHWGDYFFLDTIPTEKFGRKVRGYHIYSSAKGLYDGKDVVGKKFGGKGVRGPLFRKCYYYCGFLEEGLLVADGIHPSDFSEVLKVQ